MACVLVVDDEPDVRDLVARRLGSAGHDVLTADGPEQALRLVADAGGVDVAVLDVDMPVMDGFALLRRLRHRRGDLPAVFVTGRPWAAEAAVAAGGHYLPKPFTGALLRGAVEAALWLPPTGPAASGARPTSG